MRAEPASGDELVVDARGHRCPTPTLRLRGALAASPAGAVVVLLADDPIARIDVAHFAAEAGHAVLGCTQEGDVLRFKVRRGASADAGARDGCPA